MRLKLSAEWMYIPHNVVNVGHQKNLWYENEPLLYFGIHVIMFTVIFYINT